MTDGSVLPTRPILLLCKGRLMTEEKRQYEGIIGYRMGVRDFCRARHFRRVFFDNLNFKFVTIFMKSTTDKKV
jgi:hypothetical protein